MRKRNEASRPPASSPAGQRSGTRNSSAAKRGEEKSGAAGKEQTKPPSTVSKAGDEKASERTVDIVSPRRSHSKKETLAVTEAAKSAAIVPVPALPETSQVDKENTSIETCKEVVVEKQVPDTLSTEHSLPVQASPVRETPPTLPVPEVPEAGNEEPVQTIPETSSVAMEIPSAGSLEAVDNSTQPIELGIISKSPTEASGFSGQEQEKAATTPVSGSEAPLSVEGGGGGEVATPIEAPLSVEGGGGGEVAPPIELPVSPSQTQVVSEADHTEPVSAIHPLPSNTEGDAPPAAFVSDDSAFGPGNTQQVQVASEPAASESKLEPTSAAASVEMNGSLQQEAAATSNLIADTSPSKGCEISKATNKVFDSVKEMPSLPHVENTFDNNMVSSVEGETVLIVENLHLTSQVPAKLEENMSGAMGGDSEANELQRETDKRVNTESMLAVGKDLVGLKVRKKFGRKFFEGKVVRFESELNWYKVMYEDGDEEELDLKEVQRLSCLEETEDDEGSAKRKHRRVSNIPNSHKRGMGKTKRSGSPGSSHKEGDLAGSDDVMEDDTQLQERIKLRGLKKRLVIDTSNDGNADPLDSDNQPSATSDEASDDDDDDDSVMEKRNSSKKLRRRNRGKKRRKTDDKSDEEKEFSGSQSRLSSRLKEEPLARSQETSTEHRVATRSFTGVLSTHMTSSDDHSSPSLKKVQADSQDRLRPESPASEVQSPLGGGAKLIGRKTKKDFGGQFYIGEIVHYDNRVKYYKVRYEDGDEEELEWGELAPTLLPQDGNHQLLALTAPHEAGSRHSQGRLKEHSRRGSTAKSKEGAIILYDGGAGNGDLGSSTRKWRKKTRTASVSGMMKGMDSWNAASTSAATASQPPPRPLAAVRFASASDADVFEYFGWGEAVNFERSKCPELRATRLLPTSSPVVHLAASRHHLVALTATGQVWVWRCKHGSVHTRCNEWEHIPLLDNRNVILVDISGPDVDRASAGYQPEQEDQVPDPFYLAAVCSNGEDIILQGSQPHESVHMYQYDNEPQHPGLRDAVLQSNPDWIENVGRIVQVSVGMVEAADESPFVGYITDTDCVFIRSATRDYMEEVNLVTGYTGKPVKIQCGRVYHAIIMTDDGRAWTWGQGYYPGSNLLSAGFASKWTSPFSVCQPAVGTLVGRKVVDVGCYGEDFIALTNDGDVHQWTHALPNPAAGVYNVPATPVYGQGPSITSGDKLKQVTIGAGICAGISESGKVHTWRTSLKGGFVGTVGLEREAATPLGREEGYTETAILSLGTRVATKLMCVAGSLLVVVKRKYRGRRGGKRKLEASFKGKMPEDEGVADG